MYFLSSNSLWASFTSGFSMLTNIFGHHGNDSAELQIAAVILLIAAIVMFLFLVVLLYVKALLTFMQKQSDEDKVEEAVKKAKKERSRRLEIEQEMEKELERELEKARLQKFSTEQEEFISKQKSIQQEEAEAKRREEERLAAQNESYEAELRDIKIREDEVKFMREQEEERLLKEKQKKEKKYSESRIDLDWKKGISAPQDNKEAILQGISLQYQQQKKSLNELFGLIMNMLGRNVDDYKIAQTIRYRAQKDNLEDDIIQTIESIKNFVALCNAGKFSAYGYDGLPSEEDALYNLAHGDVSKCLLLLERLMHDNIDKSSRVRIEQKRDKLFMETSEYATTFASFAAVNDTMLATSSFELAIELSPQNINAWNKLGDMYMRADSKEKAVWAYNNLLNMADPTMYQRQVANANRALSNYYYAQGDSISAAKMYNESKRFYDAIGINNDLSSRENEIINIIEARQEENIKQIVAQLLNAKFRS